MACAISKPTLLKGLSPNRTATCLGAALAACALALAVGPAMAQQTVQPQADQGLRPLTWPSRGATPATQPRPVPQASKASNGASVRPGVIARGGYALNSTSPGATQGLTPATAFYTSPTPRPSALPASAHALSPSPALAPAEAPRPVQPAPAAALPRAANPSLAPTPPAPLSHDPMAPRRDAPIFNMGRGETEAPPAAQDRDQVRVTATSPTRYYSVHRQYGRQPDPVARPDPVYLDALPVDVTGMAGSSDLAEPPAPPNLIRNNNGRIQALPDLNDIGS